MKKIYFDYAQGSECKKPCPYDMDGNVGSNFCEDCKYHIGVDGTKRENNVHVLCVYEKNDTFSSMHINDYNSLIAITKALSRQIRSYEHYIKQQNIIINKQMEILNFLNVKLGIQE